jgi:hypothetical protein
VAPQDENQQGCANNFPNSGAYHHLPIKRQPFWGIGYTVLRDFWEKNGKTGELGQDRLEVRWEAVMFLFNVVNLNV